MTKQQLIDKLANDTGMTKKKADIVVTRLVRLIVNTIKKGDKVTITGFGTFDVCMRKARRGINPQTGSKINIPAMSMPRFRAGKRLKTSIR